MYIFSSECENSLILSDLHIDHSAVKLKPTSGGKKKKETERKNWWMTLNLKNTHSTSKYIVQAKRIDLKAFISKRSHSVHVFFFLKQFTRPTLHYCRDLEGVLDKTVCGVNLPVYRSRSTVSPAKHPNSRK